MKKLLITLIASISLTGCFYQSVNILDIQAGTIICLSRGTTLFSIEATAVSTERVTCSNKEQVLITETSINEAMKLLSK